MKDFIKNDIFDIAAELVNFSDKHVFLTGRAGTGKTTFLKYIKENTHKNTAIVAPTGVAAINAGGTTLHSFLQLPFGVFIPEGHRTYGTTSREEIHDRQSLVRRLRFTGNRRKVIEALELLIIDEISMVRADLLDMVDTVLRYVRRKPQTPFGGVQVLYIGDMFQLPPVTREDDRDLLNQYYKSPFFFDARVIQQAPPLYVELTHVYRQRDATFIRVLNEVRNNRITDEGLMLLKQRYIPGFKPSKEENYITLATHNYMADQINEAELNALSGRTFLYEAAIEGDFPESAYPVDVQLKLKTGAQVMFIKNDTDTPRRFFNGKIGIVTLLDNEKVEVTCPGEQPPVTVPIEVWKNIRYTYDQSTRAVKEDELGTFKHFPLRLAWAITIHKSQGLTFEKAIIDAGKAFEAGQVYVALSRCTHLEGMVLKSPIHGGLVMTHDRIARFGSKERSLSDLQERAVEAKRIFLNRKLLSVFQFSEAVNKVAVLKEHFREFSDIFNAGMKDWLNVLQDAVALLQNTSNDLLEALNGLLEKAADIEKDEPLQAFLRNKSVLIYGILQERIWLHWRRMPGMQTGHTRRSAEAFFTETEVLNEWLKERLATLERLMPGFAIDTFFNRRISVSAHLQQLQKAQENARKVSGAVTAIETVQDEIPHKELYSNLKNITEKLVRRDQVPSYMVANAKTLIDLCKALPLMPHDLLYIRGFGQARVNKYGEDFLEAIRAYCTEHNLTSQMNAYKAAHTKRERKPPSEGAPHSSNPTREHSLALWKELKSLPEVAKARNLAVSTVAGHLAQCVAEGRLDVFELTTREVIDRVLTILPESMEGVVLNSIKEQLGDAIGYNEIKWAMAWRKFLASNPAG